MALRLSRFSNTLRLLSQARNMSDSQQPGWGSGAGHGGGSGGSIREAGGTFGKMEAFQEEDFFRKKQAEQFKQLKEHLHDEIAYHEKEIKDHLDDIQRHKEKLAKLQDMHKDEPQQK